MPAISSSPDRIAKATEPDAPKTVNCFPESITTSVTTQPMLKNTGIATIHTCQRENLLRSTIPWAMPTNAPWIAPMIASWDVVVS